MPTDQEIKKAIQKLKNEKAPGVCKIPAEVFKALQNEGLERLSKLIRCTWKQKSTPKDFKDGVIVPVYKKGDKSKLSNYRGITLLSVAGKILTTIIRLRLIDHYEKIIRSQQAGFRSGRGCINQIFNLWQCIEKRLRHGKSTLIAFIDLLLLLTVYTENLCGRSLKELTYQSTLLIS